jgi:DNA polymerase III subunit epsilon
MSAGQLWLFAPPKPLVERFGREFFLQLPELPGVYLLCGELEGVLYVGSAKNLKRRLSAYRVANPERFPRRMIRLLNTVRRIEFDICGSEAAARHREEQLIAALLPRFNRAGKVWPGAAPAAPRIADSLEQRRDNGAGAGVSWPPALCLKSNIENCNL